MQSAFRSVHADLEDASRILGATRLRTLRGHHRAAPAHQRDRDLVLHLRRRDPRTVRRHHPVHLGDQGDLGADLRSQRIGRPRRHLGARPRPCWSSPSRSSSRSTASPASAAFACAIRELHGRTNFPRRRSPKSWRTRSRRSTPRSLPAAVRRKCEDLLIDVVGLCVTARNEDYVKAALAAWDDDGAVHRDRPCAHHERRGRRLRQRHRHPWRGFRRHVRRRARCMPAP